MRLASSDSRHSTHTSRGRQRRALVWALALLALGLVFAAYLDPHLMVDLANRVWACF